MECHKKLQVQTLLLQVEISLPQVETSELVEALFPWAGMSSQQDEMSWPLPSTAKIRLH